MQLTPLTKSQQAKMRSLAGFISILALGGLVAAHYPKTGMFIILGAVLLDGVFRIGRIMKMRK